MLRDSDQIWGGVELREAAPAVEKHYDVLFLPLNPNIWLEHDPGWGVYGADGSLIDAAAHRRGAELNLCGQSLRTEVSLADVRERVTDETLIYGGPLIPHYGHFICSSLSRLWLIARDGLAGRRIVFHATANIRQELASHRYFREFLGALGLNLSNIVVLQRPTRLDRLIIPRPSFLEQNYVSREYARVVGAIGRALGGEVEVRRRAPVYLTKTGLADGVTRPKDETLIEDRLRRGGVEIVRPETLDLPNQIRLFSDRRVVAGFIGSQFHTSAFAPRPAPSRNVLLTASPLLISNFVLFDKLRDQPARYVYPESGVTELKNRDGFLTQAVFADPARVADELLETIWAEDALFT